ncbi:uncharacterized protein SAMN05443428_11233 [Caloramator quimbayensis]|uniref:DUF177 domain-containing protein n=1 Tax=Caloramator quimbayensis TaxID=1147123 RepID=A0A1T4XT51_9CLOT|nr:DUF177 domain-containing protein [Caloramator quimbayensis]SKA92275.1 uncharacterized protein SAMN05443428_11233 [Caloramator quimbayensis]
MLLDISGLIKGNIEILPFEIVVKKESIEREDFKFYLMSPLKVDGSAYYDGGLIKVKGTISTSIKAQCSRCLETFNYELNIDYDEIFSKAHEDEDTYSYDGNTIDLSNMVIDNIILSMPIKFLCSEDCKGLCSICGKNLNTGKCNCEKGEIDPRLAVLKDLFKGD